jgi:hypothetical protein
VGAESSSEESTAEIKETQKPENISAHSLGKPRNPKTSPPQQQLLGLLELGNPSARKKEEMLLGLLELGNPSAMKKCWWRKKFGLLVMLKAK